MPRYQQARLAGGVALALVTVNGAADVTQAPETVVVSALRTPVEIKNSGSSISVITGEQLEQRQVTYISDALRAAPGLSISQAGSVGSQVQVRMRGAEANHVLVMIDGVEANDGAVGDEPTFEHLTSDQIERIEIVRGPQSALWGSDALAGVIHIITRQADEPLSFRVHGESGSFGSARAGGSAAGIYGPLNISAAVSRIETAGTNVARQGSEEDSYENTTANIKARFDPNPDWTFTVLARHTDSSREFDRIDFVTTGLPADADRRSDSRQTYLRGGASTALFDDQWSHKLDVTYFDTKNENFSDGANSGSSGAQKLGIYYQTTVAWDRLPGQRLTFGLDHEEEDFAQRAAVTPFGDPNQEQQRDTTAYVLELQSELTEALGFSAGVRHDDNSAFASATTFRVTGFVRLGAAGTRLHASYGTGQKAPTFADLFGFFPDFFAGNPALQPEKSRGWDVGVEQALFDDRLSLGAVYFCDRLEDEIDGFVFDPATLLFTARNVDGRSRRQGAELTVAVRPVDAVSVTGSYTYLDATQPDAAGNQRDEIRRPRHSANVNANYAVSGRLNLNLDVSYTGAQLDTFFPPFPRASEQVTLDDYVLLNVAASLAVTPSIAVTLRLENLLDADYEDVFGFNTPGIGAYAGVRITL